MKVAIDGPAAAGKSTVAKMIAKDLNYLYIDTGAMYRALTLEAMRKDLNLENENSLAKLSKQILISFKQDINEQKVFVDEEDVTFSIRSAEVTNNVSIVAKHPKVREQLVNMQRKLAEDEHVVMDGRDIGTYVLPDADVKVYLIASVSERAERRHQENLDKGFPSDLEQLKLEINKRDQLDSEREMAPLVKADDATEIDTTSKTIEEVKNIILELIESNN
ncbi:(d)CMP kinase [Halalkalibacillus halophilus]|uniref:(d)CMP kinase n=1 Tax=Halalkalibacillus halophilus TaxID=392827 RepID=UPI0003F4B528|nr:(d)CMP kinase [Halalkalibacillus halophilus]